LSKVASENSPAGTESVKGTIDDYLRVAFALIRQLADLAGGPTVVLASAATVNIGFAGSANISITGTTTIAAFDNVAEGTLRWVTFAGALTLTHNAASLQLPGAANIATAAGDLAIFKSLGGGNWKCTAYQRISGTGPFPASATRDGYLSATDWTSFANKQAAGQCLPLAGGAMTGNITFANNGPGIQFNLADGSTRKFVFLGADNWTNIYNGGGPGIRIFNQAATTVVWNIDDTGNVYQKNWLIFPSNIGIKMTDAGGTVRNVAFLGDNNWLNYYGAPSGSRWFNAAGTVVNAVLSDTGAFSATVITESSDERKKKAWQRLPGDFIGKLAGIRKAGLFTWKRGGARGLGVGAQSLEQILPDAVRTDDRGAKTVQYGAAALVSAVELARAVVDLRARIAKLEAQ
jgi:hypothetical protein